MATLDVCGYCPYEFCPVMESDGKVSCPFISKSSGNMPVDNK